MMSRLLLFFLFYTFCIVYAQDKPEQVALQKKIDAAISTIDTDISDKALENFKKLKEESIHLDYDKGALQCIYKIIDLYEVSKLDYKSAIKEAETGEKIARRSNNYKALADMCHYKAIEYNMLGFYEYAQQLYLQALAASDKIENLNERSLTKSQIYGNISSSYENSLDPNPQKAKEFMIMSIKESNRIKPANQAELQRKNHLDAQNFRGLGYMYNMRRQIDSAEYFYLKSYELYNGINFSAYERKEILADLGEFYLSEGKPEKAIISAKRSLSFKNIDTNLELQTTAYEILYQSYMNLGKIDSSKYYSQLFTKLNDSLLTVKERNANQTLKNLTKKSEEKYDTDLKKIIWISLAGLVSVSLIFIFFYRRNQIKTRKKYQLFIEKLKKQESITEKKSSDEMVLKQTQIADETTGILLKKLEKFEQSKKFLNPNISIASLATDLDTNTKYLSQIINTHKKKNFNNYINSLRIGYITQELYNNPKIRKYKIASLAEMSGFASREVFTSIFKKETDMNPSYFIKNLEEGTMEVKRTDPF